MTEEELAFERVRRRRFLAAAVERGFRFSEDVYAEPVVSDRSWSARVRWAAAIAASLIAGAAVATVWGWRVGTNATSPKIAPAASVVAQPAVVAPTQDPSRDAAAAATRALQIDIDRARRAERASAARAAASEAARLALQEKVDALQREMSAAGTERAAVQARLDSAQQALEATTRELSDARRQNASDAMLLELQDNRLAALTSQVRDSEDQLARQKQLLAANRDIRDLMGARNLHVIDVFDVDGRGKTRRTFGRAFYTEGKSLIFYAFDLASAATRPASFQAWGQREDGATSALSLGLLYSDDQTQNRWTLKFEDARVLEQIDAVFVTVEPPGGSRSPRGRKLLYAYLRQKANHP
jgi:hypothetical protein